MVEGPEPAGGACPGCGARYAGGGETVPEGVALALSAWGLGDLSADALARRLFEVEPAPAPAPAAAITSDRRDGFYRWWVFVREGGGDARSALAALLSS